MSLVRQFAVADAAISTNIVGAADSQRVLTNIRDIEAAPDEELLAGVLEILRPVHDLTWSPGRAENNRTPPQCSKPASSIR